MKKKRQKMEENGINSKSKNQEERDEINVINN